MRTLRFIGLVVVGLSAAALEACEGETDDPAPAGAAADADGGPTSTSTCTTTDAEYRACTADTDCTLTNVAQCSCGTPARVVGVGRLKKTTFDRCSKEAFEAELADAGMQCGGCVASDKCTVDDGTTMGCVAGSDNIEVKCIAGRCTSSFRPPEDAGG